MNMLYRGYVIVSHYSQGIQATVQGGHALVELARRRIPLVDDWAEHNKTLIILRGGEPKDLDLLEKDLKTKWFRYLSEFQGGAQAFAVVPPVASFKEPSLGSVTTAVACVLPVLPEGYEVWNRQEARFAELCDALKDYRLAH